MKVENKDFRHGSVEIVIVLLLLTSEVFIEKFGKLFLRFYLQLWPCIWLLAHLSGSASMHNLLKKL